MSLAEAQKVTIRGTTVEVAASASAIDVAASAFVSPNAPIDVPAVASATASILDLIHISRFTGITWSKGSGKWEAQICHEGKRHCIGTFEDEMEAAKAYDAKARSLRGLPRSPITI